MNQALVIGVIFIVIFVCAAWLFCECQQKRSNRRDNGADLV